MKTIEIVVRDKIAYSPPDEIVCGNSDYNVRFVFDEEWADYTVKTARFIFNGKHEDCVFEGDTVSVPIITKTLTLAVGVFAGDLRTSTPALIKTRKSILCDEGLPPDPSPDVYAQIMELLNNGSGGGSVSIDSIAPSKVVFPEDVYTTYQMGKIKPNGAMVKALDAGQTLADYFDLFVEDVAPEITQPSVSISFPKAGAYEVGTKITPAYTASFDPGSYQYGSVGDVDGTGVEATGWTVTDSRSNTSQSASGSFAELQVTDGISYKITATAKHGAGLVPEMNTGKEYPAGQIAAGTKSATSGAVTGYRNTFYGTLTAKSTPTSDIIRSLAGKSGKTLVNGNSFTVTVPVGALRVIIAYPATLRDVTSIKDVNGMNAEIKSSFTKSTLNVYGANSYTAISYKVYVLDFASALETANKFTVQI